MIQHLENNKDTSQRADILLAEAYTQYSRAALAKLFDLGCITQQNRPIKAGQKIKPSDSIDADISALQKPADEIDIPVIYEDDTVIVVNKPTGVISHARGRFWDEPSVASFIRHKVYGLDGERAGIVHRLDRATSGVMICAKNQAALTFLQKQFSQRKVHKEYNAIIQTTISPEKGIIDIPILRNPNNPKTFIARKDGKPAQTEYHTVKSTDTVSLLRLHPYTGRTHQLRVHLRYMGKPIIGDTLYGGVTAKRLMLHASSIEITLPNKERKTFIAPLPREFLV